MTVIDDVKKSLDAKRRLDILQFLGETSGNRAETSAIKTWLAGAKLTVVGTNTLVADVVMLDELRLVIMLPEGLGAKLTARGLEALNGEIDVPGVARPVPKD